MSPAPSCTGGLPWDDYKGQWGSGLTAGGDVDYIGTTGDEAILSSGYTIGLHHVATLWATMGIMGYTMVYEDCNIDGGGTGYWVLVLGLQ